MNVTLQNTKHDRPAGLDTRLGRLSFDQGPVGDHLRRDITMSKRNAKIVADVCLYGNHEIGAGWIASLPNGRTFGHGRPELGRSFTLAVWQAGDAIRRSIPVADRGGMVARVFSPDGQRVARFPIADTRAAAEASLYYADLTWSPAPVYAITPAEVLAAAEPAPRPRPTRFRAADCGGAFDGNAVSSDADPGL